MQDTGENAIEEVGLDQVRFRVPVLHGDTLYAFTEVVNQEAEPADSRGHKNVGLIHFRHWGVNQRGETVFEGERRVLSKSARSPPRVCRNPSRPVTAGNRGLRAAGWLQKNARPRRIRKSVWPSACESKPKCREGQKRHPLGRGAAPLERSALHDRDVLRDVRHPRSVT